MILRMGELFCGAGGFALGAIQASGQDNGFRHVWANDYNKDACATYAFNLHKYGQGSVYCMPVQELPITELPAIDALFFGFPCNDYSITGERKGIHGDYGPLYSYGVSVLNHHRPLCFVAENVGGLSSANGGSDFRAILRELANAGNGYQLTAHLYKLEQYGVPQMRHRIIIVGIRNDAGLVFRVPLPTTALYATSRQALTVPPIPTEALNQEQAIMGALTAQRLSFIPPGGNAWSETVPPQLRLKVKGARLSQVYRRLDPSRPAWTLTAAGGGGSHTYHWEENRALTNRERARLQTFPDDFVFLGTPASVRKQIGMAVPPLASQVISRALLKTLKRESYDFVYPNITLGKQTEMEYV